VRGRGKRVEDVGVNLMCIMWWLYAVRGEVFFFVCRVVMRMVMRPTGITPSTMTDLYLHAGQGAASEEVHAQLYTYQ
jgi:hypothetical protein